MISVICENKLFKTGLNAPPEPYTRERFDHTYQWTLGWKLVAPGATYENTVDNRAWQ